MADLEENETGLLVSIRSSKTDQERQGERVRAGVVAAGRAFDAPDQPQIDEGRTPLPLTNLRGRREGLLRVDQRLRDREGHDVDDAAVVEPGTRGPRDDGMLRALPSTREAVDRLGDLVTHPHVRFNGVCRPNLKREPAREAHRHDGYPSPFSPTRAG